MAQAATKVTVTVPTDVAEAVDREAKRHTTTRSEFIRQALKAYLRKVRKREIEAELRKGYLAMSEEERRFHIRIAEEGLPSGQEALRNTLGEEEEVWW